jgi:hypothetical protein
MTGDVWAAETSARVDDALVGSVREDEASEVDSARRRAARRRCGGRAASSGVGGGGGEDVEEGAAVAAVAAVAAAESVCTSLAGDEHRTQ